MSILPRIPKVYFEFGAIGALSHGLEECDIKRPLLITDQGLVACGVFNQVLDADSRFREFPVFDTVPENPTVEGVDKAFDLYKQEACDGVVAVGGGSVIDSSKAVALLAGHPGPISQYHKSPEKVTSATAPIIAVPTTAGTGSEVSFGAGIHPDASTPGLNIGGEYIQPRLAICDPELTMTMPSFLTAGTGMDALSHCVEGYLSSSVNPIADAVALDGIGRVCKYIERAVKDGSDRSARWHMMMAALEGGISILKGLGPDHAIGNTLGDRGFHHGTLVTVILPSVLRFHEGHAGDRIKSMAAAFGLGSAEEIRGVIKQLNERVGLPTNLKEVGYMIDDIDRVAEICVDSYFNRTSPRVPTHDEYKTIIADAMSD
jgi:hypothetical protein